MKNIFKNIRLIYTNSWWNLWRTLSFCIYPPKKL